MIFSLSSSTIIKILVLILLSVLLLVPALSVQQYSKTTRDQIAVHVAVFTISVN